MSNVFIPVLLGTAHGGRQSKNVAQFVHAELKTIDGVETTLVDVAEYSLEKTGQSDGKVISWSETMNKADGLIIVTPEYNHGYPGELKLLLDSIYDEYARKPVAICGVSGSLMGGARVVEALKLVLLELQMIPIHRAGHFSKVKELFDESGEITDESYKDRMKKLFDELMWYAETLRNGRDTYNVR